ncbi:hypothetical protein [Furfurilactobacillus entadae]|uniref:hypothetical protein n=1 Tax=Furfurilactobacillus entadae TaxID=2922307 RepID=UPI0035EEC1EF
MQKRPKPINPAMPTNIAWVMAVTGIIIGLLVGVLLPFQFNGSFIWGILAMILTDIIFLVCYRRVSIQKQTKARAVADNAESASH